MKTKPINSFPAYRLSDDGTLESSWTWGPYYPGMVTKPCWRKLPQKFNSKGYIPVCLCGNKGIRRRTHLHRLLAETFISAPPHNRACVRHLDGNARNNAIGNLAWGTYLDNENDKRRHGTHGLRVTNARLTRDGILWARAQAASGMTQQKIANHLGVSRPTISRLLSGTTWRKI